MAVSILAISTAVPTNSISQKEIANKIIDMCSLDPEKAGAIKTLYHNSGIRTRYSVIPDFIKTRKEWDFFGSEFPTIAPGMAQRNDLYKTEAPKLAYEAADKAIKTWGEDPASITHVISVSCTGMVAPGIEFGLMKDLKLNSSVQRFGINFMGCFGAFKGLAIALSFAKEDPKHRILLVCTELCSLHFQAEQTPDNILANALFSDGAAAIIVGADPKTTETSLREIHHGASLGLDNTLDKMQWEASDHGFKMKLSHRVPVLLGRQISSFVKSLTGHDSPWMDCDWAIHPGGKSIIQVIEKALNLEKHQTKASRETLANYGNMSSSTFLFVMDQLIRQKSSHKWTIGIGFGPGLSFEGILLSNPEVKR